MTKVFCCKTKKLLRLALVFLLGTTLTTGCKDDFDGYFDVPSDMEGPIYDQLSSRPELSEFVKAIDRIPLMKTIINTSGLYTVFAPTNEAVMEYFKSQTRYPGKKRIEDFDPNKVETDLDGTKWKPDSVALCNFIEAHLAIDMYFDYDFKRFIPDEVLGSGSFVFNRDRNRYSTRYKERKYIDTIPGVYLLDANSPEGRRARTYKVRPQYKSLTVYPYKYLRRHNIVNDFKRLYNLAENEEVNGDALFVNGIRVIEKDIPAVNGVIHIVNGVIEAQDNLDMYIKEKSPAYWAIAQRAANYRFNADATEIEGVSKFDSLFTKGYNGMLDFADEYSGFMFTYLMPNEKFEQFMIDSVFEAYGINDLNSANKGLPYYRWEGMDSIPAGVRSALLSQFCVFGTVWPSQLDYGFVTMSGDTLQAKDQAGRPANLPSSETLIEERYMASNALVYHLPEDAEPNISQTFSTVVKYPMLERKLKWYWDFLWRGKMYAELSKHYKKYTVFMPTREAFRHEPSTIYELENEYKEIELYRYGRRVNEIASDSILQYLVIPDVVLTPDSLKGVQFRRSYMGSFLNIDGTDENNLKIKYEYTIPGTQDRKAYESVFPNKPAAPGAPFESGYHLSKNGIVYPLDGNVPMVDGSTLQFYIKKMGDNYSIFKQLLELTKVNGELKEGDKGYIDPANDETLLQMLISNDHRAEQIYTVLCPTNAAFNAFKKKYDFPDFPSSSNNNKVYPEWQWVARQMILKTRVYSDGSHIQNYYDVYANPLEGEDNLYQTMCHKRIYSDKDYFSQNEYTVLKLDFDKENQKITFTDTIKGNVGTTSQTKNLVNVECVNGVLHVIDSIPFPGLATEEDRDRFVERPVFSDK